MSELVAYMPVLAWLEVWDGTEKDVVMPIALRWLRCVAESRLSDRCIPKDLGLENRGIIGAGVCSRWLLQITRVDLAGPHSDPATREQCKQQWMDRMQLSSTTSAGEPGKLPRPAGRRMGEVSWYRHVSSEAASGAGSAGRRIMANDGCSGDLKKG